MKKRASESRVTPSANLVKVKKSQQQPLAKKRRSTAGRAEERLPVVGREDMPRPLPAARGKRGSVDLSAAAVLSRGALKTPAKSRRSANRVHVFREVPKPPAKKVSEDSKQQAPGAIDEIQRMVQEGKDREERMHQQLQMLRQQALIACRSGGQKEEKKEPQGNPTEKCEKQIDEVKAKINNILEVTRQTHEEVQKTKDIMNNIQDTTQNRISFQSKFIEDDDAPIFDVANSNRGAPDSPEMPVQQSPAINSHGEEEAISTSSGSYSSGRAHGDK